MTTPEPTNTERLRAATSLRRAAELVAHRCSVHHGTPEGAPVSPLPGLPDDCRADVGRALGGLLDYALGPVEGVRRLLAMDDAHDLDAVADLVAEQVDWDGGQFVRLAALAVRQHRDLCELAKLPEVPTALFVVPDDDDDADEQ